LLIDDVQFLGGKEATQDEFFHTFNTLINSRAQIVLTSDRSPSEIPSLEKRLVSRFEWGISAELLPPGLETRIAILRQKAHEKGLDLDSNVVEFLASKIHRNVRHLESALLRISTYASLYHHRVTVAQAGEYLRDILAAETRNSLVTIATVQREVAEYFGVSLADLNGKSRSASIVQPRQYGMFLSRELTHSSLKEIGKAFGGRDHGTVIHACKKVLEEEAAGGEGKRVLDYLRGKIGG
jgi:chromosomal replication initiator protein